MGGVDEPGHPRFHQPPIDIDLYRGFHMIGFPYRIAILTGAGPFEEHIELASRPLTCPQTCDVATGHIHPDRTMDRRQTWCWWAAVTFTLPQLTM